VSLLSYLYYSLCFFTFRIIKHHIWDLMSYTDRIQKQYYNVSKYWNTLIIEFTPMGTPIIPRFESTQDGPSSELKVSMEPFPPQWKYQDTKMTVQKYRPRGLIITCSGLHWSRTHGETQQTSLHRKNKWLLDYCSFKRSRLMQRLQTAKVSVRISLLDTH
jgi:hypothetical protein